jgi:hypothetical protein
MESFRQDQHHPNLHPPELNFRTALRDVVQSIAPGCSKDIKSRLLNRAWAILLDRDAADTAEVCCSSSSKAMAYITYALHRF